MATSTLLLEKDQMTFPPHLEQRVVRHCDRLARRLCPTGNTVLVAGSASSFTLEHIHKKIKSHSFDYWMQNDKHLLLLCAKIVRATAHRMAADHIHLNQLIEKLTADEHTSSPRDDPSEVAARRELLDALLEEASRLGNPHSDVTLLLISGHSVGDIAEKLGIAQHKVRRIIAQAVTLLHAALHGRGMSAEDVA